jgi:hypothetical protein
MVVAFGAFEVGATVRTVFQKNEVSSCSEFERRLCVPSLLVIAVSSKMTDKSNLNPNRNWAYISKLRLLFAVLQIAEVSDSSICMGAKDLHIKNHG